MYFRLVTIAPWFQRSPFIRQSYDKSVSLPYSVFYQMQLWDATSTATCMYGCNDRNGYAPACNFWRCIKLTIAAPCAKLTDSHRMRSNSFALAKEKQKLALAIIYVIKKILRSSAIIVQLLILFGRSARMNERWRLLVMRVFK